ncbi:MAG TPA: adenylyl-sulfate kinase [Acidimicrobiales bacterium]|jgi:bifunctional enzyme CysN/CysC|nr:adenylyl-sulfate kinase [Acidimicrobiales bacterium]
MELLRLATAGSVDDGKSTLIGRLLYDAKGIFEDQLESIRRTSEQRGNPETDLALLTDGLRAEREQGITIDVAYRYFATPKRKFIIADTPGHTEYTRNMVTGASTAHVSLILIDARKGVIEQTRRHAFLSSMLGVPHMVVCVNKMDLIDWDREQYERIESDFMEFAARLNVHDIAFIPISALKGDNVVQRSESMWWYDGSPLLNHLESVYIGSDENFIDPRFPVQYVIRSQTPDNPDFRGYAGTVASGVLRPGDEVLVLPTGTTSRIESIVTADGEVREAFPPMAVVVTLTDDIAVSRGDVLCRPNNRPTNTHDIEATICWMDERTPLAVGRSYLIKQSTRTVRATLESLQYRLDVNGLRRDDSATTLELNEIGRVSFHCTEPLPVDDYSTNRTTGSFIVIDPQTNVTAGAGVIRVLATTHASPNVVRHRGRLTRADRYSALGAQGATVLFTGLSGAGKSTVAAGVEEAYVQSGLHAFLLDGDNMRHGINGDLGFSDDDRKENVRRAGEVARMFAESGSLALIALICPFEEDRRLIRMLHDDVGLPFLEIFLATSLEECERRDPKGLYARARAGELPGFTGIDSDYEPPLSPDLVLAPGTGSVSEQVSRVLELLGRTLH